MKNFPDNLALPFSVDGLHVRGRLVRLGSVLDDILNRHQYPAPIAALLGEMLSLTALLGTALKFDGKLIVQTQTDGPVDIMVADFKTPGSIRGYARFNKEKIAALATHTQPILLGNGHLAMTIDQGPETERYQAIVALQNTTLTQAAEAYFRQSEQIPTGLKLAAGQLAERDSMHENQRAGAIMVQKLAKEGGYETGHNDLEDDLQKSCSREDSQEDSWIKAQLLLNTVAAHEILDPTVSAETLLYRLYHEDGVRVYPATSLTRYCSCSEEKILAILRSFPAQDHEQMSKEGAIRIICEFCSTHYEFSSDLLL